MCLDKPDNSAAEAARREEEARQARIAQGRSSIDQAFQPFNNEYFSGVGQAYTDYYMPQLQEQFEQARRDLTLRLAKSGNLTGSAGARQLAELQEAFSENQGLIGDRALASVNDARARVEGARQDLYRLNRSSADPSGVNAAAAARVGSLQAPPVYSPLGDVFASLLNQGANQLAAANQGYGQTGVNVFGGGNKGSVKTVGG